MFGDHDEVAALHEADHAGNAEADRLATEAARRESSAEPRERAKRREPAAASGEPSRDCAVVRSPPASEKETAKPKDAQQRPGGGRRTASDAAPSATSLLPCTTVGVGAAPRVGPAV